ncbi:MAG: hypothetical protein OXE78_14320 [Gammaproteobacteria bacterium]|nr:hypothetical protein [Gammaproteobacteria bacterium]
MNSAEIRLIRKININQSALKSMLAVPLFFLAPVAAVAQELEQQSEQ